MPQYGAALVAATLRSTSAAPAPSTSESLHASALKKQRRSRKKKSSTISSDSPLHLPSTSSHAAAVRLASAALPSSSSGDATDARPVSSIRYCLGGIRIVPFTATVEAKKRKEVSNTLSSSSSSTSSSPSHLPSPPSTIKVPRRKSLLFLAQQQQQQQRRSATTASTSTTPTTATPSTSTSTASNSDIDIDVDSSSSTASASGSARSSSAASTSKTKRKHTAAGIAERVARDRSAASGREEELHLMRRLYEAAAGTATSAAGKRAGRAMTVASFMAIDVETFEFNHDAMLEFGWSSLEFVVEEGGGGKVRAIRDTQHAIIAENARHRNGKYCPDARDHFDFGTSLHLRQAQLYQLLHATITNLSSSAPLILIFHDPRADLVSLRKLGFDPSLFERGSLSSLFPSPSSSSIGGGGQEGKIVVADTQKLYSAWRGNKLQVGLGEALKVLQVPTRRLHNAGNDALYTLALFELLMDPARSPAAIV